MAGTAQTQSIVTQLALNGKEFCFVSVQNQSVWHLVDGSDRTMCGVLDHISAHVVPGITVMRCSVLLEPTPEELDVLFPLLGFTESPTDTFTITDTIPAFTMIQDLSAKVHTYSGCKVDKWFLRGQKGLTPVTLELQILGLSMSEGAAGSFSADAISATGPYAFSMGTLTLRSETRAFDRFVLMGDHHMNVQHNNSVNATSIAATQRTLALGVSTPYTFSATASEDETALFTDAIAAARAAGTAGILAFANGNGQSTSLALANCKIEPTPPSIPNKAEVRLDQYYKLYKSGSTAAVIATHDATAA